MVRLTPEFVIRSLSPFLGDDRRQRIDDVVSRRLGGITVVLEAPYDPHNGAAVIRTAEALGLVHLHIVPGPSGFSFSRRITVGCEKWMSIQRHKSISDCLMMLKTAGFSLWAAVPPSRSISSAEIDTLPAFKPIAIVIGNEHDGLSDTARALCDGNCHLAMYGFSESLNLSVSAALMLEQLVRTRRNALAAQSPSLTTDLALPIQAQLTAWYYSKSVRAAGEIVWNQLQRNA